MKNGLIDLHLHLDGSLSVDSVKELAAMQNIEIPEGEELLKRLRVNEDCRDLNEYLEKFDFPLRLLQTKEGIAKAVENLCTELKEAGLIYAEIRFAPQLHTKEGLSQAAVVEAACIGRARSKFPSQLILCCMRGSDNSAENIETVRLAKEFLGKGVCAVDLAGAEALFPTENFAYIFHMASDLEIPYTIHAGEAAGPESVKKALELGAWRIGHGVRSIEDEELMKKLAQEKVPLELCPTSNLQTCIFSSIEEYPLRKFMEMGIPVTVNTDNMTVSGVDLEHEMNLLIETFKPTQKAIKILAQNAAKCAFLSDMDKMGLLMEIEKRFA